MPVSAASRRTTTARRATSSAVATVRVGSRGASVVRLQNALRAKGYRISADGSFGPATLAAVKAWQRRARLAADGVVGPRTWASLGVRGGGSTGGSSRVTGGGGGGTSVLAYRNGRATRIRISSVGNGQYLRTDAARNFRNMQAAARRAGIRLSATSGFRTMAQQRRLYALYRAGRGNLAARPGYSNHQQGLSMDVGGIGGYGTRAYRWLRAHARQYGFVNDVRGEFWHWTFRG